MKALKDFNHRGIEVKAGEEVGNDLFEPDDCLGLVAKGLIGEEGLAESEPASEDEIKNIPAKSARKRSNK